MWKRNAATSQTASLRTTLCASATIRQRRISFYSTSTSLPPLLQLSTQSTHTRASKSLLCVAHLLSWHEDIQYVFVAENNCLEILRIVVGVGNIISTIIPPPSLSCSSLHKIAQQRTLGKLRHGALTSQPERRNIYNLLSICAVNYFGRPVPFLSCSPQL